jgi:hypothetical protein
VESYELESPFDIFGTTIKAVPAKPPPKGKWNRVLPQEPIWDVWAKMGIELRSVQVVARKVGALIYELNEWGAKDSRIPGNKGDDEPP